MNTDRKEMIARIKVCIEKGADPNTTETVDLLAVDDPSWEKGETLVSLYMYRVIGYHRAGTFQQELHRFMLPKAARVDDPFDLQALVGLAAAYTETWDGEAGNLDRLHAFVDAFTTKQLACIGI